jgi:hypothetical protein
VTRALKGAPNVTDLSWSCQTDLESIGKFIDLGETLKGLLSLDFPPIQKLHRKPHNSIVILRPEI